MHLIDSNVVIFEVIFDFFPKDINLGVLKSTATTCAGVCVCVWHVSGSLIVGGETGRGRQGGRSSGRGGGPDS